MQNVKNEKDDEVEEDEEDETRRKRMKTRNAFVTTTTNYKHIHVSGIQTVKSWTAEHAAHTIAQPQLPEVKLGTASIPHSNQLRIICHK